MDPSACEARFRVRLAALGATPLYEKWLGSGRPRRVRCGAGHTCFPRPGDVLQGCGICQVCSRQAWDIFYVVRSAERVKFGVTHRNPRRRLRTHASRGYTTVERLVTGLPGLLTLETEGAVKATLALAGEKPVHGREYFDLSCLPLILDVADSWLITGTAEAAA
jgi:hypothetical protein